MLEKHIDYIKLHLETVAEDLEKNIVGTMREELQTNGERLDRIEASTERMEAKLGKIDNRLAAVETTLEQVGIVGLKKKRTPLQEKMEA